MKVSDFQSETGISNGYLANTRRGKGKVGEAIIEKILSRFPEVDIVWLITGKGNMFKSNDLIEKSIEKKTDSENNIIPLIPIEAVAGISNNETYQISDKDIEDKYIVPQFKKVNFLIRVYGNSMYPKYYSGDMVACRVLHEPSFVQWNKVYVLDTEQGALIKKVLQSQISKDNFTLVSENSNEYPPFEIPKRAVRRMALVVGLIRVE